MADESVDPIEPGDPSVPGPASDDVPIEEEEAPEPAHPRRAASAEFVVRGDDSSSSVSVLREAMDPANQSLADALKLSFRVLQIAIVGLVVLFLFSGLRNVETNQTGVRTLFGEITGEDGIGGELQPGLNIGWPYPITEFIVFNRSNAVSVNDTFWPDAQIGRNPNIEEAGKTIRAAEVMAFGLGPGRDGYALVEDGLAHLQMQATYTIDVPTRFVRQLLSESQARDTARLALQRGTVLAMAGFKLDDALDQEDVIASKILEHANSLLTDLKTGIKIERVQVTNVKPPVALVTTIQDLSTAVNQAEQRVADAKRTAQTSLVETAGQGYSDLLSAIADYETVVLQENGQDVSSPEAQQILNERIDKLLQSDQVGGSVAKTIAAAQAYQGDIQATLGVLRSRFMALRSTYRANPELTMMHEWMATYDQVLTRETAEIMYVPEATKNVTLHVKSLNDVMLKRREIAQQQARQQARDESGLSGPRQLRMGEANINRRLQIGESGEVRGRLQN